MINAFHLFAAVVAMWRITELFGLDKITLKLRQRFPCYLWNCPRCLSVWAGIIVTVLFYYAPWVNWPFAMSWLYLWAADTANARRAAKKQEEGRTLKVVVKPDGQGSWNNELTPPEIVSLVEQLLPGCKVIPNSTALPSPS